MSASIWRLFPRMTVWAALIFAGWGGDGAHASEGDCDYCPQMTLVQPNDSTAPFAVSVYEVTQGEFNRFVDDTGHSLGDSCGIWDDEARRGRSGLDWRRPGRPDNHPVVCVSWEDAQAYADWLSDKTGKSWRLLTEAEWEYVARAGATTPFNTGDKISKSQAAYGRQYTTGSWVPTEPVGSFKPNGFGLYDVHGNVWEWTADCSVDNPAGAVVKRDHRLSGGYRRDAAADEDCPDKVLRGGSWRDDDVTVGLAVRSAAAAGDRTAYYGFRVARSDVVRMVFRDCDDCPEMVVVPSGNFMMGSPRSEEGRYDSEGPRHRVTIRSPFAVGVYEVTRGEFGRFVSSTNRSMGDACLIDGEDEGSGRGWWNPGFSQTDSHPVVCVSWGDAQAYVRWLSRQTREAYRLLSESEWEYVARARTETPYWWGDDIGRNRANCGGCGSHWDGKGTAPVGSFAVNGFGLHDIHGNVWEFVQDCWNDSYEGAPGDGSAWESGECSRSVGRGGAWLNSPVALRVASRGWGDSKSKKRYSFVGFRVTRRFTP